MSQLVGCTSKGFTLVELMVTITVAGILSLVVVTAWTKQIAAYESNAMMMDIASLLKRSASEAMVMHRRQVVCFTANQADCVASGFSQVMSFTDANKNGKRDEGESMLQVLPIKLKHGKLKLSAGLGSSGFVFMEDTGRPRGTQGNVTYCADNGDMTLARSIIVNKQGRIRKSHDHDGDGIDDRRSRNDPVRC